MTLAEAMKALEAAGTAQNRKVYARHGSGENCYGVSFAVLGALTKQIKRDHKLARQLWTTGNADARILATMIADPQAATTQELDEWIASVNYYVLADSLAKLAAQSPHARTLMKTWMPSKHDFTAQVGYDILAVQAMNDPEFDEAELKGHLAEIERTIHGRSNRTRHAMNNVVISIGLRNEAMRKAAIEAAKRIGKVEVDHGETSCRTPDAVAYIEKAAAYYAKRAAKQAAPVSRKKSKSG